MTKDFSEHAAELFLQGHSCSEAVVKAAHECSLIDSDLSPELINQIASPFSGGLGGNNCLCGAVAGAQIILGLTCGRKSSQNDPHKIKTLAKELNDKFKEKRKATCCHVLSAKYRHDPRARRQNCSELVKEASEIAQSLIQEKASKEPVA